MRVITGTARGRRLVAPPGLDTRPTSEVAKEAVFSIIQFEIEGARVLDLFAGSGQMGVEALSRGAKSCVFVDTSRACQQAQRQNLSHTGLADRARIVGADAASFLRGGKGPFDIAFLDPPYGSGLAAGLLPLLAAAMSEGGVILCETERRETLPEEIPGGSGFVRRREYRYGKAKITLYRGPQDGE